jgi:hypothetical protein
MSHVFDAKRYERAQFRRCGRSGSYYRRYRLACGRTSAAPTFSRPRNELVISSKPGWHMWPGPYGVGGSRKYLPASLDAREGAA